MSNKRKATDPVEAIGRMQKTLQAQKPPLERMYKEVQMMQFKVRPVQGDILSLNIKNKQFIEALWSLGKLEELFQKEYKNLPKRKQDVFFNMFDTMHRRYQDQLSNLDISEVKDLGTHAGIEMEIFKDTSSVN